MHYVYILKDESGKLYVGYSSNLRKRLRYHHYGMVQTTKGYSDSRLVWYCGFIDKKKALDFERYLKVGSGHAFARKRFIDL